MPPKRRAKKLKTPLSKSKLNNVLSVIYNELEWLKDELAALDQAPDNYILEDKPDLTSRQDELLVILKKCDLPLNR